MRVFLKRETSIIDLIEENPPILTEITPTGYFRYKVSYVVDPVRAVQNDAITVKILATTKPFIRQNPNLFAVTNPEAIIDKILQKNSITKDQGRSQQGNVFFSYVSDISSKIPNDKANQLSPKYKGFLPEGITFKTETSTKLVSTTALTRDNTIMPVLENNISSRIVNPDHVRINSVARTMSTNLVYQRAIDPAQISGARTNSIQSAKKVSGGIIANPAVSKVKNFKEKEKISLLGNLVNAKNPMNHLQIVGQDLINVVIKTPRSTIDIEETLDIPVGLAQLDEFFLVFQLVDKNGITVQEFNISVPHGKNIANLKIPTVPPLVEVLQSGLSGKNVVNVKQQDPTASGIAVYRKEQKTNISSTDASYVLVGRIETRHGDDFQRIEDFVNNYNSVLYRAISYSENGILSSEFSSFGAKALQMKKKKVDNRKSFVSLSYEIQSDGISLEVRDIPPGVCLISIYKKNIGNYQKLREIVAKPVLVSNQENQSPVFIFDSLVKNGKIYEYECELLFEDGLKIVSGNKLCVKYQPAIANIVKTTITTPEVTQKGNQFDVTFKISSILTLTDMDQVKKTLTQQNLLFFFEEDIFSEKEKLQNILAWGVTRTNLTTGDVENLGITTEEFFSDQALGNIAGASPIQSGFEYRYSVTTFLRNTDTTLQEATRTITFQNKSYTYKPAKWRHPITLANGTLVSEQSLKKNYAQSMFTFGSVGDITNTQVSVANILPSVSDARSQKLGKNSTLVSWKIQGSVTKIDHFIITMEMLGMKTVVGKCHNITESNYFQFVDKLDNGEHGNIKYTIVPVFYDFTRGTEMVTNEVVV